MGRREFIDNDQFYTKEVTVDMCMNIFEKFVEENNIDLKDYIIIEPSVGSGNFYKKIPENLDRIAIDLYPDEKFMSENDMLHMNYLDFMPSVPKDKKYIVLGNPPFGKKGILAKDFIKHSIKFADYVFFILPMGLNSNIFRNDIRDTAGYDIIEWYQLPTNSFTFPDGTECNIDTIFSIISRKDIDGILLSKKKKTDVGFSIKHININDLKKTYNKEEIYHIGEEHVIGANFYLPHIIYKGKLDNFKLYNSFEELNSNVGWAIYTYDDESRKKILSIDFSKDFNKITKMSGLRYSVRKKLLTEFIKNSTGEDYDK